MVPLAQQDLPGLKVLLAQPVKPGLKEQLAQQA